MFTKRLAAALAARTQGELTRLVADLPPPATAVPAPVPGVHGSAEEAWSAVVERVAPAFVGAGGYAVADQRPPHLMAFEREYRPWWVWILVVAFFPFGLLALLIRNRERAVVTVTTQGDRARIDVTGSEPKAVGRALARLRP